MRNQKILVIGANGQIGTALSIALGNKYGISRLVTADINPPANSNITFEKLDVLDRSQLQEIIKRHGVNEIYHLAAILSAKGEATPLKSWQLNMNGLFNVLETAKDIKNCKVLFPSSIAVFGHQSDGDPARQNSLNDPDTVYGISKTAGELWCQYYHNKYNLDVRSLRYPGVIGHQSMPGGGTTDYAVEIFHDALQKKYYQCFLKADSRLPMIYMADAVNATLKLMETPQDKIKLRTGYNITGFSFTPVELANEIKNYIPDFTIDFVPDFRQKIADNWPKTIDDAVAKSDWGWQAKWSLQEMVADMFKHLKIKYNINPKNISTI